MCLVVQTIICTPYSFQVKERWRVKLWKGKWGGSWHVIIGCIKNWQCVRNATMMPAPPAANHISSTSHLVSSNPCNHLSWWGTYLIQWTRYWHPLPCCLDSIISCTRYSWRLSLVSIGAGSSSFHKGYWMSLLGVNGLSSDIWNEGNVRWVWHLEFIWWSFWKHVSNCVWSIPLWEELQCVQSLFRWLTRQQTWHYRQ